METHKAFSVKMRKEYIDQFFRILENCIDLNIFMNSIQEDLLKDLIRDVAEVAGEIEITIIGDSAIISSCIGEACINLRSLSFLTAAQARKAFRIHYWEWKSPV